MRRLKMMGLGCSFLSFLAWLHHVRLSKWVVPTQTFVSEGNHDFYEPASCFVPHSHFRNKNLYHFALPLPTPVINLGFPKAGTNTLARFFQCGNYTKVSHQHCNDPWVKRQNVTKRAKPMRHCGVCMTEAVARGEPPLRACGNYDAHLQIDMSFPPKKCYWPQGELLDEIHKEEPNATFLLNLRNVSHWYHSLSHWSGLHNRVARCHKLSSNTYEDLSSFYCKHVERVRAFVLRHPSHALVEIDVEDPKAPDYLFNLFQISQTCFGHHNANPAAHL